jgi:hypothetical protein
MKRTKSSGNKSNKKLKIDDNNEINLSERIISNDNKIDILSSRINDIIQNLTTENTNLKNALVNAKTQYQNIYEELTKVKLLLDTNKFDSRFDNKMDDKFWPSYIS